MIYFKTKEEIELLRKSSLLVAKTHAEVAKYIQPGVTTKEMDKVAEEFIISHGGKPGFKGYNGFPATLCISINDEVVHGIPSSAILKDGDIVSVDCGVLMNGFYGDSAFTYSVGNVSDDAEKLMQVTRESLYKGIEMAVEGNRLGDIGYAIQKHTETHGFSVVRDLVGHGVGRNLHEKPEVPNYGKRGSGIKLKEGMVIAIEPMVNAGKHHVTVMNDNWTIKTKDGSLSAHFEHTIAIKKDKADILSSFKYIDEGLKKNKQFVLI
ncbi:MAG TPA: type I methionyl aminopeptidase [Flavobacteriales bacterium]|nr:type I methionyl aminopeptidase [Flavobacteriales bacterium]HIN40593.1 type I methionyl aminopeptidase [Flavobacteriales bacterium]